MTTMVIWNVMNYLLFLTYLDYSLYYYYYYHFVVVIIVIIIILLLLL